MRQHRRLGQQREGLALEACQRIFAVARASLSSTRMVCVTESGIAGAGTAAGFGAPAPEHNAGAATHPIKARRQQGQRGGRGAAGGRRRLVARQPVCAAIGRAGAEREPARATPETPAESRKTPARRSEFSARPRPSNVQPPTDAAIFAAARAPSIRRARAPARPARASPSPGPPRGSLVGDVRHGDVQGAARPLHRREKPQVRGHGEPARPRPVAPVAPRIPAASDKRAQSQEQTADDAARHTSKRRPAAAQRQTASASAANPSAANSSVCALARLLPLEQPRQLGEARHVHRCRPPAGASRSDTPDAGPGPARSSIPPASPARRRWARSPSRFPRSLDCEASFKSSSSTPFGSALCGSGTRLVVPSEHRHRPPRR